MFRALHVSFPLGKGTWSQPSTDCSFFSHILPPFLDNCLEYESLSWPGELTEPGETRAACDPQAGQKCPTLLLCSPSNCSSTSAASPACTPFQNVASQSQAVLGGLRLRQGPSCGAPHGIHDQLPWRDQSSQGHALSSGPALFAATAWEAS